MKTHVILIFVAVLLLSADYAAAQAVSGQNPAMYINRNNGYQAGLGKLPVLDGDLLGRLELRGWVSDGLYHTGAQLKSTITGPVNADGFAANLQFSTGYPSLLPRLTITAAGRVGIGTELPDFDLHTVGNTHTTGDFYGRIHFDDNQATDDAPNSYIDEAYFELKQRGLLGLPAGPGLHGGLLSLAPGGSSLDHQLFFGEDGIFTRRWDGGAASWAGATWYKMLTSEDINGTPNRVAKFTAPSSLGDSQLWDDGTQVGIGTDSPTAGFFLDVDGPTRINGNTNIERNLDVAANTTVDGSATVQQSLEVNGDATLSANLSLIGSADLQSSVDIAGMLQANSDVDIAGMLRVNNDVDIAGMLRVNNDVDIAGLLRVNNDVDIAEDLDVGQDVSTAGNLEVQGTSHLEGVVSIATTSTPGSHELYVGGSMIAEEVVVKLATNWPDYVFDPNRPQPDIKAWARYIAEHRHLPGMPSATEMEAKDGVPVGQTQQLLLEKIEELTLILIQQQAEIDALKAKLAE